MRTEDINLVVSGIALALAGCVSTSIGADLARIETMTSHELSDDALEAVDPLADEAIEDALERPLDADAAVRIALANRRELRAVLRELGIERGRLLQASLLPNPTAEIDLRHQDDRAQPLQIELFVEYELTEALLAPLRVAAAERELDAARYRAAGEVLATSYEVRAAFYAVQAAQERVELATRALDALAAARDAAQASYDAGNVPELDLATRIAAYEEERAETAELELDRAVARERLSRLLGVHGGGTAWTAAGPLPPAPEADTLPGTSGPDAIERTAIESSLELAETRMRLEAIAQRVGLARTEGWLPDISVDAHAEQDGTSWEIGGGASFTLPLFDRNEGNTAMYEAQFDGLMERYLGAAVDIRSAAREGRARLDSARLRALHYQGTIVPARQRVFDQTLLQYNAMQVDVFRLVAALRARLGAELAAVDARREYWTARAALDSLLAGRRVGEPARERTMDIGADDDSAGGH